MRTEPRSPKLRLMTAGFNCLFVQNIGFFKQKSGFSEVVNEEQHVHDERERNKDTVAYAKQIITLANTLLG